MTRFTKLQAQLIKSKKTTVLCHQNADPDAVCAAIALKFLLKQINPKIRTCLIFPAGVTETSENILKTFKIERKIGDRRALKNLDILFLVDASSYVVLGPLEDEIRRYQGRIAVIDHHKPNQKIKSSAWFLYVDEGVPSTAELIFQLFQKMRVDVPRRIAQLILTGIMFDSGYFSMATPSTFKIISTLCEKGARLEDSRVLLQSPMSRSEKIARIKGAQRSVIKDLGYWIFASSEVNSHQASAARALIGLGADVAMVQGGEKKYRINFRSSSAFSEKTKIHLGNDIAGELGKVFNGEGGGHDRAAGFNLKECIQSPEKFTNEVLKILKHKVPSPNKKRWKKDYPYSRPEQNGKIHQKKSP